MKVADKSKRTCRRVMKYKRVTMQQTKAKPNGYIWQTEVI